MTKLGRDLVYGKSLLGPVKAYVKLQGTEFEYLPVRGRGPLLCSLSGLHSTCPVSMNMGTQNLQLFCLSRAVSMPKVIYFAINRFSNLELSRSALQIPSFFRTQFLQRRHRYMLWFWELIFFDKAGCISLQIDPV